MSISIEKYEQFDELSHMLDQKASEPEPPYWFYNHAQLENGYDEADSLCWDCIHQVMPDAKIGEHFGGGWCCQEDGCEACEKCGKLLDYTLTDCGVQSELDHFTEHPPENLDNKSECYSLARIAHGISTDENKLKFIEIMSDAVIASRNIESR